MGSDRDEDRSTDNGEKSIADIVKKRRLSKKALLPRVVMEPLDISPGTLAEFSGGGSSASGVSAFTAPMAEVLSSSEPPSITLEEELREACTAATAARKRTAPLTPPIPSPRRVTSPETTATAAGPKASTVTTEGSNRLLEQLIEKLDRLTERLAASEKENAALRNELELYRTGARTVLELQSTVAGTGLGNQAVSQPGPSKRTAKRSEQRARAAARQAEGPAHQRLLELQENMRLEIEEERRQQQRLGVGMCPPQQHQQQQKLSYRDALTTGWQVVGQRNPRAAPQHQQRPQPPRALQRPPQPARRAPRRRPDAIIVIPAQGVSFAEMYRPIRTDPALDDAQEHIRIGKRTPKGNLRMELKRDVDSWALCRHIQVVLGELGTVKVPERDGGNNC
uniref:Uncharacterized protein n=1 Tax=Anopheles maculatus TaxID=74869 RepID=A0A182SJJ8_9DIPT